LAGVIIQIAPFAISIGKWKEEIMIAIRQIQTIKSGSVTVTLPPDFDAKQVEIIILPMDEIIGGAKSLQDLLLAAPTLTENELEEFNKTREWISQWTVKDF
jgi:hypothetical protein